MFQALSLSKLFFLSLFGGLVKTNFTGVLCGDLRAGTHTINNELQTSWWISAFPKIVLESWKPGYFGILIKFWGFITFFGLSGHEKSFISLKSALFWLDHSYKATKTFSDFTFFFNVRAASAFRIPFFLNVSFHHARTQISTQNTCKFGFYQHTLS